MSKFIPVAEPSISQQEIDCVTDAVKSGWVSSLGEYIDEFERKFAEYICTKYALTTSNGTTALHLALVALGVKSGGEVIVPDLTFIATANAVAYTGATPLFVDIKEDTWCIDPESIRKAVTPKTKAIIPVHLYGHPADMDHIIRIANENSLFVIEDAAEAHGAEYKGKKVGSFGNCGTFSFYGNKIITTGEGGMITTNDKKLYERAKLLRDQAMSKDRRYWHTEIAYNYRITNLQAALGLAQLERIDELIAKKRKIFNWYKSFLSDLEGIRLNTEMEWAKNVYWMVCLVLDKDCGILRDEFMSRLREAEIDTRPFFYPVSQMPMYNESQDNPVTNDISQRSLNLPSGVTLTKKDVERVSLAIKSILGN